MWCDQRRFVYSRQCADPPVQCRAVVLFGEPVQIGAIRPSGSRQRRVGGVERQVDRAPTTAWTNRRRECGDWSRSGAPNPHPGVAALHEAVGARSDRTVPCARVPRRRADHPRAPPAMELPRNRERAVLQRRSSRTRRQSEVRCGARTVSKATAVVDRCRRSRRGTERSGRCRRRRHRR